MANAMLIFCKDQPRMPAALAPNTGLCVWGINNAVSDCSTIKEQIRDSGEYLAFSLLSSQENATPILLLSPFAIR